MSPGAGSAASRGCLLFAVLLAGPAPALVTGAAYSDSALQKAATSRLARKPALRGLALRVEVSGSLARLEGAVQSLAQAETARRAVAEVRGLIEVDAGDLVVAGTAGADDLRLRHDIESAFERFPALRDEALRVEVEGGRAAVSGSVRSAGERRLVVEAVRGVPGVQGLDLRVEPREGSQDDDAKIESQIRGLLADRLRFPIQGTVEVKVRDRLAILEGSVQRVIDKLDAEELAWCAGGVRGVRDALSVVPRPRVRMGEAPDVRVTPPAVPPGPQADPETPEGAAPEDGSDGTN